MQKFVLQRNIKGLQNWIRWLWYYLGTNHSILNSATNLISLCKLDYWPKCCWICHETLITKNEWSDLVQGQKLDWKDIYLTSSKMIKMLTTTHYEDIFWVEYIVAITIYIILHYVTSCLLFSQTDVNNINEE